MPYTRCPACATGFRISASQLSAAGGQVRCGHCGAGFDALEALSDDPSEASRRVHLRKSAHRIRLPSSNPRAH